MAHEGRDLHLALATVWRDDQARCPVGVRGHARAVDCRGRLVARGRHRAFANIVGRNGLKKSPFSFNGLFSWSLCTISNAAGRIMRGRRRLRQDRYPAAPASNRRAHARRQRRPIHRPKTPLPRPAMPPGRQGVRDRASCARRGRTCSGRSRKAARPSAPSAAMTVPALRPQSFRRSRGRLRLALRPVIGGHGSEAQ